MTPERFCPNCGSQNVEPDTRHTNVLGEMMFNQNKWLCNNCGYTGIMPEGDPQGEFEPKEQEPVDTDAGRGYFKYIMYLVIPFFLLLVVLRILI
ncbi:MAG: hypothetical protein ABEJ75_04030 [Candidatus Nanohaloarchaea archaeon]